MFLLAITMLFPLAVRSLPDFNAVTIWNGLFVHNPYTFMNVPLDFLPVIFVDLPAAKY